MESIADEKNLSEDWAGSHIHEFMRGMGSLGPPGACPADKQEIPLPGAMMCSIRVLHSVTERAVNRLLEEHELTLPQWLALGCISHGGAAGVAHGEIGNRLMLSKAPITGVVDRLERAGLVERQPDPKDRRISRVVATAQGVATWLNVRDTLRQHATGTVNAALSPDEQALFLRLSGKLLNAFAAKHAVLPDFGTDR